MKNQQILFLIFIISIAYSNNEDLCPTYTSSIECEENETCKWTWYDDDYVCHMRSDLNCEDFSKEMFS